MRLRACAKAAGILLTAVLAACGEKAQESAGQAADKAADAVKESAAEMKQTAGEMAHATGEAVKSPRGSRARGPRPPGSVPQIDEHAAVVLGERLQEFLLELTDRDHVEDDAEALVDLGDLTQDLLLVDDLAAAAAALIAEEKR